MSANPKGGRLERIEPTIGGWNTSIDAETLERTARAGRKRRIWRSVRAGLEIIVLFGVLIGGALIASVHFGGLRYPEDFTWTNTPARTVVVGMAMLCLGQVIAFALTFRNRPWLGLLSLLVPGILLLDLRHGLEYRIAAVFWGVGVATVAAGLLAMP